MRSDALYIRVIKIMALVKKKLTVKNTQGLHARPAALFVQVANKFNSRITVKRGDEVVNGKSIMGILMLGAEKDSEIIIEAEGDDAQMALSDLEKVVVSEE
jgi:phosphotransferase system HPr (HPr) family protein